MSNSPKNSGKKQLERGLKLVAKSSVVVFLGILISNVITYVYRLVIARFFGVEAYGQFSIAIMVTGILVSIFSLGIVDGIGRFIPYYSGKKQTHKTKYLIKMTLRVLIVSGLVANTLLFIFAEKIAFGVFHNSDLFGILRFFSFLVPIWMLSNLFLTLIVSSERVDWHTFLSNIFVNVSRLLILFFLIFIGIGKNSIFISYFISYFLLLALSIIVFNAVIRIPESSKRVSKKEKKIVLAELFAYSWPIIFTAVVLKIYYWADSFFIGYLLTVSDVGIYNAAVPISLLLSLTPTLFLQLFVPMINKYYATKKLGLIEQLSKQIGKWIFIINIPVFLLMFLFPGAIINALFGKEYLAAATSLRILSVGTFLYSLFFTSEKLLLMKGKSKMILANILFTSIFNIVLNYVLIQKYGINGAAIATATTWTILSLLLFIEGKYFVSIIPMRRNIIKIFLISLIPLGVVIYIKSLLDDVNFVYLLLLGSTFFIIYILLLLLAGGFDKNDKIVLNAFRKKASFIISKKVDESQI